MSTNASAPVAVTPLELQVSSATNQMGLQFLMNLPAEASRNNVVFSPLSLQIILNLILLGANDPSTTQAELAKVLGYEADSFKALTKDEKDDNKRRLIAHDAIQRVVKSIMNSLSRGEKDLDFSMANLVLTNPDVATPSEQYLAELKQYYDSTNVESLKQEAANPVMATHERVNKWVAEATKKQITHLIGQEDLPPLSEIALVLLNAANFKGKWLNQFAPNRTTDEVFYNHGQESEAKKVKFMHQADHFSYVDLSAMPADTNAPAESLSKEAADHLEWTRKLDCRVLSLPFSLNQGQELDMLFLLPNKRDGLAELIKQLSSSPRGLALVFDELETANKVKVQVDLPKFSFETTHDAKGVMTAMGLNQVFSDAAQLERMFKQVKGGRQSVKVDKLIHKAKISVDESGAEASAATIAVMSTRSMSWPPREPFTANRPFLFMLRHTRTGMLLFTGTINAL